MSRWRRHPQPRAVRLHRVPCSATPRLVPLDIFLFAVIFALDFFLVRVTSLLAAGTICIEHPSDTKDEKKKECCQHFGQEWRGQSFRFPAEVQPTADKGELLSLCLLRWTSKTATLSIDQRNDIRCDELLQLSLSPEFSEYRNMRICKPAKSFWYCFYPWTLQSLQSNV